MQYNRAAMKQAVRQAMKGTRPRPIWVTLLYMVVAAVGAWLIQGVIGGIMGIDALADGMEAMAERMDTFTDVEILMEELVEFLLVNANLISRMMSGSVLISILSYLWNSTMAAGYVGYSLKMVRGQNPAVGAIFSAFPRFGKVLITNILVGVFTALWGLLFAVILVIVVVIAAFLMEAAAAVGIILLVLAYVGLIIAALWLSYRFALTNYLVMDQGISGLEALTVSKKLMKGNKFRLFVLQLSFLGWYLLYFAGVMVCVGVMALGGILVASGSSGGMILGVLLIVIMALVMLAFALLFGAWITPYMSGVWARFYEYTMSCRPDMFTPAPSGDDSFGHPDYPKLD